MLVARLVCLVLPIVAGGMGCRSGEPRYAARQAPAGLVVQRWQAPCSLDLPQPALHRRANVVEPGDEVEVAITTGHDAEARATSIVDDDGTVVVPKIGRLSIAGTSPRNAERSILQACFERGIPTKPLVEVTLKHLRQEQITVLGGVTKPGVCNLPRDRRDLVSALAAAGGLARNAGDKIVILRPGRANCDEPPQAAPGEIRLTSATEPAGAPAAGQAQSAAGQAPHVALPTSAATQPVREEIELRAIAAGTRALPMLEDGDVVTVEQRDPPTIQVLGMVQHPGSFELPVGREYRVLDAIGSANGAVYKVVDTVVVCRKTGDNAKRALIQVSLHEAARNQEENILLLPGDVVRVDPSPLTLAHDAWRYGKFMAFGATMMVVHGP